MTSADYEIALATRDDIAGILDLQEQNLPEQGGVLSVRLPFEWFETALADLPMIVARRAGRVAGYLVASSGEQPGASASRPGHAAGVSGLT